MKSILIVSQLDMLKAGNQTLFKTVQGYLVAGYRVILLTSNPESKSNQANYKKLFGEFLYRVQIYRFNPILRPLAKVMNRAKQFFSCYRPAKNTIIDSNETVQFETSGGGSFLGLISWSSFILGGIFNAIKLAKQYKVEIIYGYEIYGAPVGYIASRILHIPLVTRFQGTMAFPELERGGAWLRIPHQLLALKIPADLIIMANDGSRGKDVLLRLGVPKNKILFWINGVKKDIYIPRFNRHYILNRLGLNDQAKVILTVSRLQNWKRVDRAIKAIAQVIKKIPNAFLVVVGDGKERKNLEQLAEILEVRNHVLFEGAVPYNKVKYYFNMCDIFLSLYDHSNLCNPVLEASGCGNCIITIDDGSTRGLLTNGYNAIFIKKKVLEKELPETIAELLHDDEKRSRISENARKFAEKQFLSWEDRMVMEVNKVEALLS